MNPENRKRKKDLNSTSAESKAYTAFKRVRNRLGKHYPKEVIFACISRLAKPNSTTIKEMRHYPPWLLLLLVKWTLLHGEYYSSQRRHLTDRDFTCLVNLLHDFSGKITLPNPSLFLRNVAFQQFWFQEHLSGARLARQSLMFGHLEPNHPFHCHSDFREGRAIGRN